VAQPRPRLAQALSFLLLIGPATHAAALWDDQLELFASQAFTHDSNVFRLSSGSDPNAVLGSPSKDDTYGTTSLGFNLDVPLGRQRLQGGFTFSHAEYQRFTVLSHDGHQARAAWLWQVGNDLGGQLGYKESVALASLANIQGGVQSATPNLLTTRNAYVNAAYLLTPRWRLRGEASRQEQQNSAAERQVNDVTIDGLDLTFTYVTPADNQIGLGARVADGRFPNRQVVAGTPFDNAYRQQNVGAVMEWRLSGHSRVTARAGRVSRNYAQLSQRDFEDDAYEATYEWRPAGNLALTALAQRDISAVEEINVSLVRVKRAALYPALRLTEKTGLTGLLEYSDRAYFGDPGLVLGTVPPRTERVRALGLAALYRPAPRVTLQLSARRETRTSSVALGDYAVNIYGVTGRLAF
jgi:exopolysaccharide biosynthesis operon protein EpsL